MMSPKGMKWRTLSAGEPQNGTLGKAQVAGLEVGGIRGTGNYPDTSENFLSRKNLKNFKKNQKKYF
jgi:hypothetical protein